MRNRLPLPTANRLRELFVYDQDTGVLRHRTERSRGPNPFKQGDEAGHTNAYGYRVVTADGRPYLVHRIIWKMQTACEPGPYLDHINRERGDNRWSNLREADAAQNTANSAPISVTGVKGVTLHPISGKWVASIRARGAEKYLGSFDTLGRAAEAYRREAESVHGEFAHAGDVRVECEVLVLTDDALLDRIADVRRDVGALLGAAERAGQVKFAQRLDALWVELAKIEKIARPHKAKFMRVFPKYPDYAPG